MTARRIVTPNRFIGVAGEEPTYASNPRVRVGDTFYATDTGVLTINTTPAGDTWVEKDTIVRLETSPTINIGDVELITATGDTITDDTVDAIRAIPSWLFGKPTLISQGHGSADWQRGTSVLSTHQKGSTGWVARLFGGEQTGYDDAASVYIPVNEMPLTDLDECMWSWFQTTAETIGLNMVVWAHHPDDFNKRVEITMEPHTQLEKAAGWNAHELASTDSFQFGGENVSGNDICQNAYTSYTWAQFQADAFFKTLDVYRIEFSWGFWNEHFLEDAYLAEVSINGTIIPLKPSIEEQLDMVRNDSVKAITTVPTWTFGEATLRASNDGEATWSRWHWQKGGTGWTAKLYGGVQTNYNDWARVMVPVNELPLHKLESALWTWYNTGEEIAGVAMQIHIHDPADNDHRVDVTQASGQVELTAGWVAHELLMVAPDQFFWWGEDGPDEGSDITEGASVALGEFLKDPLFSTWTIFKIDLYWGCMGTSVEFEDVWVADFKINGTVIPMKPDSGGTGKIGFKRATADTGNITTVCAPKTPFRLLNVMLHLSEAATSGTFTLTCNAGLDDTYDTLLYSKPMAGVQDVVVPFGEGYEFFIDDEIDAAWTNSGTIDWGITFTYQTVF